MKKRIVLIAVLALACCLAHSGLALAAGLEPGGQLATLPPLEPIGQAAAGDAPAAEAGYRAFENDLFTSEIPADWSVLTQRLQYQSSTVTQPHDEGGEYCYFEIVCGEVPESAIQERYAGLIESGVAVRLYDATIAGQPAKVLERGSLGGSAREIFAQTPEGQGYRMNFYCPDRGQALDFSAIQPIMDHFLGHIDFKSENADGKTDDGRAGDGAFWEEAYPDAEQGLEYELDDEALEPQIWLDEGVPYEEPEGGAADRGDAMVVVNCESWVSLREQPSTSARRLMQVPLGAVVTNCQGRWNGFIACDYGDARGFILAEYLAPYRERAEETGGVHRLGDYVGRWRVMDEDFCTVEISRAGGGYRLSAAFYRIAAFDADWVGGDETAGEQIFRAADDGITCTMEPMGDSFLLTVRTDGADFGGYFDSRVFVCVPEEK